MFSKITLISSFAVGGAVFGGIFSLLFFKSKLNIFVQYTCHKLVSFHVVHKLLNVLPGISLSIGFACAAVLLLSLCKYL